MGRYDARPCPCGSGLDSYWVRDADGIELCRTCTQCHDEKMKRYRPDILSTSSAAYGEQVDEDPPDDPYDDVDPEPWEPEDQDPGDVLGDYDERPEY